MFHGLSEAYWKVTSVSIQHIEQKGLIIFNNLGGSSGKTPVHHCLQNWYPLIPIPAQLPHPSPHYSLS